MKIKKIAAMQILDSRGVPTIQCSIFLENGACVKSSVPSGASVGKFEAIELRDKDPKKYLGKSVFNAIENIEKKIAPAIINKEIDLEKIDKVLINLDGTDNKSNLGANAILAVSIAIARAQAKVLNLELYEFIAKIFNAKETLIPQCMFNILNGGVHADSGIGFQEFMIMPILKTTFAENLQVACVIYHNLKSLLKKDGYSTGVGDEGGFAPRFSCNGLAEKHALDYLVRACQFSGFEPGKDVVFCLDVAASQFYDDQNKLYFLGEKEYDSKSLIDLYDNLINSYPIYSIEDGLYEDDWDGWKILTERLGSQVQLVGDDIFVTNELRIKKGIQLGVANAALIKPNQIGTVTETLNAIRLCKDSGYKTVISHRSGETCDTFISDLVVGTNSGQFKAGAPCRGERVVKYNRLLEIENNLKK